MKTFYWYDYETFGLSPKVQRISQFAGIRTNEDFEIINELELFCSPTLDSLPAPEACAVTGMTPQDCEEKGLIEHEFIKLINNEFTKLETCIVGYNSIAFDDEFTRYTLFRNFLDPYAWRAYGNTRFDILLLARFCYAHKEEDSLKWVIEKNKPIFKLDRLAPENSIEHANAHDAMADVRATIGIARIIKEKQPKLFEYALSLNQKEKVKELAKQLYPMLLTSSTFGYKCSFTRMVTVICDHPRYPKSRAIVFNLKDNPKILIDTDIDILVENLFSKKIDLDKRKEKRLGISELAYNKNPMFVCSRSKDSYQLSPITIEKFQIDMKKCMKHLIYIQTNIDEIKKKIKQIYSKSIEFPLNTDADQALYDNFISNEDRLICNDIQNLKINEISSFKPAFKDKKLSELFLNFKARNYPESLSEEENIIWNKIVKSRLEGENNYLSLKVFKKSLIKLLESSLELSENEQEKIRKICDELQDYANLL